MKKIGFIIIAAIIIAGSALEYRRQAPYRGVTKNEINLYDWEGSLNVIPILRNCWFLAMPRTVSIRTFPRDAQEAAECLSRCSSIQSISIITVKSSPGKDIVEACGKLPNARSVEVHYAVLDDGEYRSLLGDQIKVVFLDQITVTRAVIEHLSQMNSLEELYILACNCPAELVSILKLNKNITLLDIRNTNGFDANQEQLIEGQFSQAVKVVIQK